MVTRCNSMEVGSGEGLCREVFVPMLANGGSLPPKALGLDQAYREMTSEEAARVERLEHWLKVKSAKARDTAPPSADYFCAIQIAKVEDSTEKALLLRGRVDSNEFKVWLPKSQVRYDPTKTGRLQRLWVRKTILRGSMRYGVSSDKLQTLSRLNPAKVSQIEQFLHHEYQLRWNKYSQERKAEKQLGEQQLFDSCYPPPSEAPLSQASYQPARQGQFELFD